MVLWVTQIICRVDQNQYLNNPNVISNTVEEL